jgi:hypothetical protein
MAELFYVQVCVFMLEFCSYLDYTFRNPLPTVVLPTEDLKYPYFSVCIQFFQCVFVAFNLSTHGKSQWFLHEDIHI